MSQTPQFTNMRARFQRHSDARFFSGWVHSYSARRVVVQAAGNLPLSQGDRFHFEIHGADEVALFTAESSSVDSPLFEFSVTSPIQRLPRVEDTRLKVRDVIAYCGQAQDSEPLTLAKEGLECAVIDLSHQGLALRHPEEVEKGSKLDVEVVTPLGRVLLRAEVRYCRPEGNGYRLGLHIVAMDRINRGRYGFFLQSLGA